MDYSIYMINIQIMFELPLASIFKVIVESFDFGGFNHLSAFATYVVITRKVNHLDTFD